MTLNIKICKQKTIFFGAHPASTQSFLKHMINTLKSRLMFNKKNLSKTYLDQRKVNLPVSLSFEQVESRVI